MSAFVKILVAGGLATASLFASAESIAPRHHDTAREINERQARQEQRIERGVARGLLTRHEARELRRDQREIRRAEAQALADGRIDWREARRLTAMLDAADARIRELRHDRDHVARRG
jgi:cell division septum initiation protein DivIVA